MGKLKKRYSGNTREPPKFYFNIYLHSLVSNNKTVETRTHSKKRGVTEKPYE